MTDITLENVAVKYGRFVALRNICFDLPQGHILGLVGPNGAGKTTLLKAIAGGVPVADGKLTVWGETLRTRGSRRASPREMVKRGVVLVPEGRHLFADLSVRENLLFGGHVVKSKTTRQDLSRVIDLLPRLKERLDQLAGTLSGGEQQMLAVGRALMSKPKLLLVDELSLGLAPLIANQIRDILQEVVRQDQLTLIAVEENMAALGRLSDRLLLLRGGQIRASVSGDEIDEEELLSLYLG